ncbi:MAG: hypothetical protein WC107_04115 [Patescibacteria group bacterium]
MKRIRVLVDSSGAEVYRVEGQNNIKILEKEIDFAGNYTKSRGLNFNDEEALVRFLERLVANYFDYSVEAYAGGIFSELGDHEIGDLLKEVKKRARIELVVVKN